MSHHGVSCSYGVIRPRVPPRIRQPSIHCPDRARLGQRRATCGWLHGWGSGLQTRRWWQWPTWVVSLVWALNQHSWNQHCVQKQVSSLYSGNNLIHQSKIGH